MAPCTARKAIIECVAAARAASSAGVRRHGAPLDRPRGCSEASAGPTAPSAHTALATLAVAIERDRHSQPHVTHTPTQETATLATARPSHPNATAKFHGDRDILVATSLAHGPSSADATCWRLYARSAAR
jgi:hypothetical protein